MQTEKQYKNYSSITSTNNLNSNLNFYDDLNSYYENYPKIAAYQENTTLKENNKIMNEMASAETVKNMKNIQDNNLTRNFSPFSGCEDENVKATKKALFTTIETVKD